MSNFYPNNEIKYSALTHVSQTSKYKSRTGASLLPSFITFTTGMTEMAVQLLIVILFVIVISKTNTKLIGSSPISWLVMNKQSSIRFKWWWITWVNQETFDKNLWRKPRYLKVIILFFWVFQNVFEKEKKRWSIIIEIANLIKSWYFEVSDPVLVKTQKNKYFWGLTETDSWKLGILS